MSPLAPYRRLLDLAGAPYVLVAFLARLPTAMSQLGTLLLVSTATGSYALGGLSAGALAVANAVAAPVTGALADRLGQRHLVLAQSLIGAASLIVLVVLVHAGAPDPTVLAAAALAGLTTPQVGSLARVRWRPITAPAGERQTRLVAVAFAYEGAADEASFVVGPALVGLGAVAFSPAGAILLAAALLAVFGTSFALHRTARDASRHSGPPEVAGRLFTPVLGVLVGCQLLIGCFFGSTQTGTTVLATATGQPGIAGLIHAALGVGSVVAGIATVFIPERIGLERRILLAVSALLVLSLPLLVVGSLTTLALAVAVAGCAVAPFMIGVFTLGERVVAPGRVATAMTVLAGATGVGYALGSSVAGRLADEFDYSAAFSVAVAAMGLGVVLTAVSQGRLRTALTQLGQPGAVVGAPDPGPVTQAR